MLSSSDREKQAVDKNIAHRKIIRFDSVDLVFKIAPIPRVVILLFVFKRRIPIVLKLTLTIKPFSVYNLDFYVICPFFAYIL